MAILFDPLAPCCCAVSADLLLSHAIAWYESASARPGLVPGRFAAEQPLAGPAPGGAGDRCCCW